MRLLYELYCTTWYIVAARMYQSRQKMQKPSLYVRISYKMWRKGGGKKWPATGWCRKRDRNLCEYDSINEKKQNKSPGAQRTHGRDKKQPRIYPLLRLLLLYCLVLLCIYCLPRGYTMNTASVRCSPDLQEETTAPLAEQGEETENRLKSMKGKKCSYVQL